VLRSLRASEMRQEKHRKGEFVVRSSGNIHRDSVGNQPHPAKLTTAGTESCAEGPAGFIVIQNIAGVITGKLHPLREGMEQSFDFNGFVVCCKV
jgi:hypothetical protein